MGIGDLAENIKAKLSGTSDGVFARIKLFFSRRAVRIFVILLASFTVLAVILTIIAVKFSQKEEKKPPPAIFTPEKINGEDIFLPNEPDFIPEIIFEQQQKKVWTEKDAGPFWTDPQEYGAEVWQENMNGLIDQLLERVP